MSKIINGVASEYDIPMKYENKTTTVFIDTQDMEERYGEELYKEYLEKENQQLKVIEKEHQKINGELREENKRLKEIMQKAKEKSIHLQNRYDYILDDLTFLLDTGVKDDRNLHL